MKRFQIPLDTAQREFPRHNLSEHVDSGGQKDVFRGEYDGQEIVLKTLVVNSYEATKRAEREIEAMKIIDSDILVDLIQEFPEKIDGNEIFVMVEEYVSGDTLRNYLDTNGPNLELGIELGREVITLLKEFEEKSMVHRDIKPRNIMRTGEPGIKVLDVGIVRMLNEEGLTPTHRDHAPGTRKYSAPEQLENQKDKQDTRTDLFSTGIVMFESMTGVHPYNVEGLPIPEAIQAGQRRSLSDEVDHPNSEEIDRFFDFLLSTTMNERFRKPGFALEELERIEEMV